MTDLSATIAPKSDQINADDLIAGPRTITVTRVSRASEPDQPIAINFDGDNGKPYKPCKSMRRVLVAVWGADGAAYTGRRMTLYCDPDVMFGGMKVGGIRISHVSGIEREKTLALTVTRAKRAPFVVRPLKDEPAKGPSARERLFAAAREAAGKGQGALAEFLKGLDPRALPALEPINDELHEVAARVSPPQEEDHDPETGEVPMSADRDEPAADDDRF